ncbi:zinc finger protein DPF3 isoform X4 [Xyrauchen texanus]|uniref:zinc finger protein DPF3 isoform X4 n=1 Tax=Xyrauchen texanus TaxID=154827 RepID=UPI00224187CB|nr:zinc finger protein DPF3 isoform X4 [Xyrauchen texanus]
MILFYRSHAQILNPRIVLAILSDTEDRIGCFSFIRVSKNSEIWNIGLQCGKMATVIQNPLKSLGDQFYKEAIEHCRSYNARLCAERSVRMPFLDSQTGVAQNNCYIWMEKRHRRPGLAAGQMYTYPARCWRKKRRLHQPIDPQLRLCELRLEAELMAKREAPPTEATALEALLRGDGLLDKRNNNPKEEETLLEIQRVLEADENGDGFHDDEDFEVDTPKRKHRNKGRSRGSGRRRTEAVANDDQDKPYVCDICGKRYKNRPGLSYHYAHTHLAEEEGEEERETEIPQSPPVHPENHKPQKGPDGTIIPNDYCDFCLGDSGSNRKTGQAEKLVSCSDCGRSADRIGGTRAKRRTGGVLDMFGDTSESEASTFHGFEEDDLDGLLSDVSTGSPQCR